MSRSHGNAQGALQDIDSLPLHSPDMLANFGTTLVVAPHQDDETLGCGGAIALLRDRDMPVRVVFTSDGTGSHPNSIAYPPDRLRDLRELEAREATTILGVPDEDVSFLRMPDTRVPHAGDDRFDCAVERFREAGNLCSVDTMFVPWRRDPHADHRATWQIVMEALRRSNRSVGLIEYPIWVWDLGERDDFPRRGEATGWRLDITSVLDRKLAAIDAYRSQTTGLIEDDPTGFRLKPGTLAHFRQGFEVFIEVCGG